MTFGANEYWQPWALLGLLCLCLAGFEYMRRRRGWAIPSQVPITYLAVVPLLLSAWGAVWFSAEKGSGPGWSWRQWVLTALALGQLPVCGWVIYRLHRWLWAALPLALVSLYWTAIAWLVGAMALVDDWF